MSSASAGGKSEERARLIEPYADIDRNRVAHDVYIDSRTLRSRSSEVPTVRPHDVQNAEEVSLLVKDGAFLDGAILTRRGPGREHREVPLLTALLDGRIEAASALLDAGADPDGPNAITYADGSVLAHTALHIMANLGSLDGVNMLVSAGAAINRQSTAGWTPLHFAAASDHVEVVRRLLALGADATVEDLQGKRAVDVAGHDSRELLLARNPSKPASRGWSRLLGRRASSTAQSHDPFATGPVDDS